MAREVHRCGLRHWGNVGWVGGDVWKGPDHMCERGGENGSIEVLKNRVRAVAIGLSEVSIRGCLRGHGRGLK